MDKVTLALLRLRRGSRRCCPCFISDAVLVVQDMSSLMCTSRNIVLLTLSTAALTVSVGCFWEWPLRKHTHLYSLWFTNPCVTHTYRYSLSITPELLHWSDTGLDLAWKMCLSVLVQRGYMFYVTQDERELAWGPDLSLSRQLEIGWSNLNPSD